MAKTPLRTLRIKQFRGSTKDFSITFDSSRPLTLIYGENGSGKTTICDAFDFIGNRRVGSLEGRGLGQVHPYWSSAGQGPGDILVELTTDSQTWRASASGKNVSVAGNGLLPRIEVLRRSSLLKLVQNAPSERYEALKPFMDFSAFEQAESALRSQFKESRNQLNEAATRIAENKSTLQQLFARSGDKAVDELVWAEKLLSQPPADVSRNIAGLRSVARAIEDLLAHRKGSVAVADELGTVLAEQRAAEQALRAAESDSASGDAALVQLLTVAKSHFDAHGVGEACPLCDSAERIQGLGERVEHRLAAMKELSAARARDEQARARVAMKQAAADGQAAQGRHCVAAALEAARAAPKAWADDQATLLASLAAAQGAGAALALDDAALSAAAEATNTLITSLQESGAWYKSIETVYRKYGDAMEAQKTLAGVVPRLECALQVCETQRKAYLDAILSDIATEVGRLYEAIHPGEGLSRISLKLDPKKAGSLDLGAEFMARPDQPPHAYFSESHLDSLGLCIFLALASRGDPKQTILVMDDVLGSIDEPHVDRLVEMLYAEASRFKHTIITTHYRPWREKFRWGRLKSGECELIELGIWDASTGIASARLSHSPLFELRQHLTANPPLIQSACASAGVLLEAICDNLTTKYECRVPKRPSGQWTLGDMLPSLCDKKLIEAIKVEVQQADGSYLPMPIGPKLAELHELAHTRNIFGCHYNELANHLPAKEAVRFATLVEEVGAALICDQHGWPESDKSGSYWATRGDTRRLHPLKKPR